jgi:inosose dehydratase
MDIACSTITWNSVRRDDGGPYAGRQGYTRILNEVREAGYSHVVASVGRLPFGDGEDEPLTTPEGQLRFLADRGLKPAPGYVGADRIYEVDARPQLLERVKQAAAFTCGLGLDALFLGPPGAPHRHMTAGHFPQGNRPDDLTADQWLVTLETLNRLGEACRAEGVWLSPHNHAGMYWETEDEYERLVQGTDPGRVGLGPDVGHMVWGGIDPLPWFRRHMDRVKTIHIKDMNGAVLRQAREEKLSYPETSDRGVFAEIGEGCVDWPALFTHWRDAGFDGIVTVETDRTTKSTPAESAAISRRYLRDVIGV